MNAEEPIREEATGAADESVGLAERLRRIHRRAQQDMPALARIAVALYDPDTDALKTFAHSRDGNDPLDRYEARLAEVPSLQSLADTGGMRRVGDMHTFGTDSTHSTVLRQDYRSSITWPFYRGMRLAGFLFMNATEPNYFSTDTVRRLEFVRELLVLMVLNTLKTVETINATVTVAKEVSHYRDEETGSHIDRVAHYARFIARERAGAEGLSDEFVEMLHMFSPLHDLGKVAVPDSVLLKPGRLTAEEFEIMKGHTTRGSDMVQRILRTAGMDLARHGQLLFNVVRHHHESFAGGGYPDGLWGRLIPLEARIVAVADVFDALTSRRPYKEPWPVEKALDLLREERGQKFDPDCVDAFLSVLDEVLAVKERFKDDATFD